MKINYLILSLLMFITAHAWSDSDHDEARNLRLQGEILPLTEILKTAQAAGLSSILEAELENKHDQWCYEIEGLSDQNQLIEILIDAKTGDIISTEFEKKKHKDID